MGRNARRRPGVLRPATALVVGGLTVVMLACVAVLASAGHQVKLANLGLVGLYLSFGLVGVYVDLSTVRADLLGVVEGALEPTHLSLWVTPVD
jgi:hypothetical protein